MPKLENPPEEHFKQFNTPEGEKNFIFSNEAIGLYRNLTDLMHHPEKFTFKPTQTHIDRAKAELHKQFIKDNEDMGPEISEDQLLENLDKLHLPI